MGGLFKKKPAAPAGPTIPMAFTPLMNATTNKLWFDKPGPGLASTDAEGRVIFHNQKFLRVFCKWGDLIHIAATTSGQVFIDENPVARPGAEILGWTYALYPSPVIQVLGAHMPEDTALSLAELLLLKPRQMGVDSFVVKSMAALNQAKDLDERMQMAAAGICELVGLEMSDFPSGAPYLRLSANVIYNICKDTLRSPTEIRDDVDLTDLYIRSINANVSARN